MFYSKLNNEANVYVDQFLGAALSLGLKSGEDLRDTNPESPTFGNLVIPPEVEHYELSQEAIEQYNQYVEMQGFDVNNLAYNPETGLFEEPTENDLSELSDQKTIDTVRAFCTQLLDWSDKKVVPDNPDMQAWVDWRASIRAIMGDPLNYLDQLYPPTPFTVPWGPINQKIVRVEVSPIGGV